MRNLTIVFLLVLFFVSCEYFKQDINKLPIARVNNTYLYENDIKDLISETTSKKDSALIINNYITRWATQQLLIDQSKINLPQEKQDAFDKLVEEYKNDLYTEAYKSNIVSLQLDSIIKSTQLENYYNLNKENFKLNDELLKVRYLQVDINFTNLSKVKERFLRFDNKDKIELSELSIQFISYNLNDSTWVKKEALFEALPIIQESYNQVLKKSNITQLQDSLGVYLVKIEAVLQTNDIAPLSYVKPTIEQIILNKRKLELLKILEKDITKDAIKNKNFEIYNNK